MHKSLHIYQYYLNMKSYHQLFVREEQIVQSSFYNGIRCATQTTLNLYIFFNFFLCYLTTFLSGTLFYLVAFFFSSIKTLGFGKIKIGSVSKPVKHTYFFFLSSQQVSYSRSIIYMHKQICGNNIIICNCNWCGLG